MDVTKDVNLTPEQLDWTTKALWVARKTCPDEKHMCLVGSLSRAAVKTGGGNAIQ